MFISVGCDTNPEHTYGGEELFDHHDPPEACTPWWCSSKFHFERIFCDTSVDNSRDTIIRYVSNTHMHVLCAFTVCINFCLF